MKVNPHTQEFKIVINDIITPILRALKFKKRGKHFYRSINGIGQAFSIHESNWNTNNSISFTFKIGIMDLESYSEIYNKPLPKIPKESNCEIRIRLAHLMNEGHQWYTLHPKSNLNDIIIKIKKDLDNYVVPFFEKYSNPILWNEYSEPLHKPLRTVIQKFTILENYGQRLKAEEFWNTVYAEAHTPRVIINEIHISNNTQVVKIPLSIDKEWIKQLEDFAKRKGFHLYMPIHTASIVDINYGKTICLASNLKTLTIN